MTERDKPFSIFDLYSPEYVAERRAAEAAAEEFWREEELHPKDPAEAERETREFFDRMWKVFEAMGAPPAQPSTESQPISTPSPQPPETPNV